MIVVTVDLLPHGDETKKRTLATAVITNDGTGTEDVGNYAIGFGMPDGTVKVGKVIGHKRKARSVWYLLHLALSQLYTAKNCTTVTPNAEQAGAVRVKVTGSEPT